MSFAGCLYGQVRTQFLSVNNLEINSTITGSWGCYQVRCMAPDHSERQQNPQLSKAQKHLYCQVSNFPVHLSVCFKAHSWDCSLPVDTPWEVATQIFRADKAQSLSSRALGTPNSSFTLTDRNILPSLLGPSLGTQTLDLDFNIFSVPNQLRF
jgi:hypothetical protein